MSWTIGFSILTQLLSSAGNFVVSLLILRILSLEAFGQYVYVYIFVGVGQQIAAATAGSVYHVLRPRFQLFARHYDRTYSGFNLIVTSAVIAAATALCVVLARSSAGAAAAGAACVFIAGAIASDALKLQATAEARHALVFYVELARQAVLVVSTVILGWRGTGLDAILYVHGGSTLAASAAIMIGTGWRPGFRRMWWLARRHYDQARYLVPSVVISTFHGALIILWVAQWFGPAAVGQLRTGEMPFAALGPLKSSLGYFLPEMIHKAIAAPDASVKQRILVRCGLLTVAIAASCVAIWLVSIVLLPLLTHKDYPIGIGLAYCIAHTSFFVLMVLNMYMNVIGRSDLVFKQSIVGSVAAFVIILAVTPWLGHTAAAVAVAGSTLAMVLYAVIKVAKR